MPHSHCASLMYGVTSPSGQTHLASLTRCTGNAAQSYSLVVQKAVDGLSSLADGRLGRCREHTTVCASMPLMKMGTGRTPSSSKQRTSCGMYPCSVITCFLRHRKPFLNPLQICSLPTKTHRHQACINTAYQCLSALLLYALARQLPRDIAAEKYSCCRTSWPSQGPCL